MAVGVGGGYTVFHWADYTVFGAMLAVSAVIGLYHGLKGRHNDTTDNFLMGGRDLQALPVALSLQASFLSAIFVLGIPTEVYVYGTLYGLIIFGYCLAYPVVAHVIVPLLHRLGLTSGYEYLELRYHRAVRCLGSVTFSTMTVLYMAVALYTPALAFSQVTGLSMLVSILGTGVVCTFYTVFGGMKAVVWTDAFQMLVILAGLLALLIQACMDLGGLDQAWIISRRAGRVQFANWDVSPAARTTVWSHVVGGCFLTLAVFGSSQTTIQRYLAVRKLKDTQTTVYLALVCGTGYLVLVLLVGVVMFAYYDGCDPLTQGRLHKADQMVPLFMMDVLGHLHGLPGLFTACTFSAALSTVSSGVNALAAVTLEDIIKPLYSRVRQQQLSETAATKTSKGIALVFGLLTVGLALLADHVGALVVQIALSIFGMAGGPLLGVFLLAIFCPCSNTVGALVGLSCSLVMSFWVGLGAVVSPAPKHILPLNNDVCAALFNATSNAIISTTWPMSTEVDTWTTAPNLNMYSSEATQSALQPLYNLSYMWYSAVAVLVCVGVGLPVSLLTGGNREKAVDSRLIFSWRRLRGDCCYLRRRGVSDMPTQDGVENIALQNGPQEAQPTESQTVIASTPLSTNGIHSGTTS